MPAESSKGVKPRQNRVRVNMAPYCMVDAGIIYKVKAYLLDARDSHYSHRNPKGDDKKREGDISAFAIFDRSIEVRRGPELFVHSRHP